MLQSSATVLGGTLYSSGMQEIARYTGARSPGARPGVEGGDRERRGGGGVVSGCVVDPMSIERCFVFRIRRDLAGCPLCPKFRGKDSAKVCFSVLYAFSTLEGAWD